MLKKKSDNIEAVTTAALPRRKANAKAVTATTITELEEIIDPDLIMTGMATQDTIVVVEDISMAATTTTIMDGMVVAIATGVTTPLEQTARLRHGISLQALRFHGPFGCRGMRISLRLRNHGLKGGS